MNMRIEINLDPSQGDVSEQLRVHLGALGYVRETTIAARGEGAGIYGVPVESVNKTQRSVGPATTEGLDPSPALETPQGQERHADGLTTLTDAPLFPEAPAPVVEAPRPEPAGIATPAPVAMSAPVATPRATTRTPGQPAPGRLRRTKAEMAEDAAMEAAAPKKTLAASLALISTGEERIDPAVDAQDRADEKAEVAATKKTGLSMEDLREAVARYVRKVGIPRAQKEVPAILGCPMIMVPETDEALAAAIAKIENAGVDPAPKIEKPATLAALIAEAEEGETHASLDDVVEAFRAYARKYDGHDDFGRAAVVREDGPRLLEQVLGVRDVNQIAKSPVAYGKALNAINGAVLANPFKREVKG